MSSKKRQRTRKPHRDRTPATTSPRQVSRVRKIVAGAAALGVATLLVVHYRAHIARLVQQPPTPPAHFVGSSACISCHPSQSAEWNRSQHRAAMTQASEQTVLARFDSTHFTYAGTTTNSSAATGSSSSARMDPTGS